MYCRRHPGAFSRYTGVVTRGLFGWSLFALPLWWIAGRGIEALIALRRNVIAPRIHWIEAAISCLLLFFGTVGIVGFFFNGVGFLPVHLSELLWGFLGGIILLAWRKQRRRAQPAEV
jgi:hypothetical protein